MRSLRGSAASRRAPNAFSDTGVPRTLVVVADVFPITDVATSATSTIASLATSTLASAVPSGPSARTM